MSSFEWIPVVIFLLLIIKFLTEGFFYSIFSSYFKAKEKYEKKEKGE